MDSPSDKLVRAEIADVGRCLEAVNWVYEMIGLDIDADRNALLARNLAGRFTVPELRVIIDLMVNDEWISRKAERGKPLSPADFSKFRRIARGASYKPCRRDEMLVLLERLGLPVEAMAACGHDASGQLLYAIKSEYRNGAGK